MILEAPGVFTMHVPQGWSVTGTPGRAYELTRPDDDGALHISVYQRTPGPLTGTEASDLVTRFLGTIGPDEPVEVRVLPEGAAQIRAVARCVSTSPSTGHRLEWLVFLVVWPTTFLMCTSTSSAGSSLPAEAEMMFAAIAPPAERHRSLLRHT